MSVIVPDGMPVDQALRLLWRESIRENIPDEIKKSQFRLTQSFENHVIRREFKKRKRRARAHKRKLRRKGQLRAFIGF